MRATRATRELACLALGHDDGDSDACPASDEELLAALVQEVQRLRVAAGEVEETLADRIEQIGVLDDAVDHAAETWSTGNTGERILDCLIESGYRLVSARRP